MLYSSPISMTLLQYRLRGRLSFKYTVSQLLMWVGAMMGLPSRFFSGTNIATRTRPNATYMLEARYDSAGGCFVVVIFAVTAAACCLLYVSAAEFCFFFRMILKPVLFSCLSSYVINHYRNVLAFVIQVENKFGSVG